MSAHKFAPSEVVALKETSPQTCWKGTQKQRLKMLGREMSFLLKPLKQSAEEEFEIKVKGGDLRRHFSMEASHFCDTLEAKNMPGLQLEAART